MLESDTPSQVALLGVEELSRYLGVPVSTLYLWRTQGKGPRAFKVGKLLRWRPEDVEAWIDRQAGTSDSDGEAA